MAYMPLNTVTVTKSQLTESVDLTQPLTSFVGQEAYLVALKGSVKVTLSIGAMMTFIPQLDLTQPVGTAFTSLLTDAFVEEYGVDYIPHQTAAGFYNNRLRVFSPLSYKDYQVHFTSVDTPTILDDPKLKGYLDDLVITSNDDLTYCLVAVNGVFHRTALLDNVLYVLDGFRTIRLSGRKDITIVDTREIGGHTIIPLTTANVEQTTYKKPAIVTLPSSIAGKTIFPVIDGYFYHRDSDVLSVMDDTHLKIKTNKLPLIQQFRHNPRTVFNVDLYGEGATQTSRKYVDDYEAVFLNKSSVPTSTFTNLAFQYSRLTAYSSFLVVMNNPHLYTLVTDAVPTGTPQFYEEQSTRILSGMVNYGCGLCPSYVLWRDPYKRKAIFLSKQDNSPDYQLHTLNPPFIPALSPDPVIAAYEPVKFIDYVSA